MNGTGQNSRVNLILGGARSGKSRYAENMLEETPGELIYIATAQAFDDEMRQRIDEHRSRRSARWATLDAPFELANSLKQAGSRPALVDCLTLWLSNLILAEQHLETEFAKLEAALKARAATTVVVSNEVGLGIVPDNALARRFRDEAGRLNQRLASQADRVILITAGLPLTLKDKT